MTLIADVILHCRGCVIYQMKGYSLRFLVMHRSMQSLTLVSCNNTKRIPSCSLRFHFTLSRWLIVGTPSKLWLSAQIFNELLLADQSFWYEQKGQAFVIQNWSFIKLAYCFSARATAAYKVNWHKKTALSLAAGLTRNDFTNAIPAWWACHRLHTTSSTMY